MVSGLIRVLNCLWALTSVLPGGEGRGGTVTNLCLALRQAGKVRELFLYLLLVNFQLNNQNAKVAYFGVAYCATLQVLSEFEKPNDMKKKSVTERITGCQHLKGNLE